jgi:hypothetical protein
MIPTSWVLRGGALVAVLIGTAPLGACETRVNHADAPRAVDQLASILADDSAINAIMGTTALRVYYTYRSLPGWPEGDVYSRPECMPQIANAMEAGYHGTRYGQVRGARLADNPRAARAALTRRWWHSTAVRPHKHSSPPPCRPGEPARTRC